MSTTAMNAAETRALAETPTTQDERILAASAYLSTLAGFWFVVPAALFVWKRNSSRFVAYHAAQATLLHLAWVPIMAVALGLAYVAMIVTSVALPRLGDATGAVIVGVWILAVCVGTALPLCATVWMGVCAMRGSVRRLPLLGRWAEQAIVASPSS